jgi:hypothetical protein
VFSPFVAPTILYTEIASSHRRMAKMKCRVTVA